MTSPRSYDGVGYPSPSFSSGTPIYDSLVAERGVPQIAPINVPAALPPALSTGYGSAPGSYDNRYGTGYDTPGSNLPALPPARLALGPGPSSAPSASGPATAYIPAQSAYAAAPQPPVPGYGGQQQYQRPQPAAPGFPQGNGSYQPTGGQSFGGQNTFVGGQAGQQTFGAQPAGGPGGFGQPGQPQGFGGPQSFGGPNPAGPGFPGQGDQGLGGGQLRPAMAPVRQMQPQRPNPYGEHGQFQSGGYQQAQGY